ncbi:MAG TPA: hypothetical protein VHP36_09255 [Chitinispirillaceae bacterium]|nr:hypothetical protein [Chitinispirillaceae bacterium]
MNRAFLAGIFLLFTANIFSNPWNDNFAYASLADSKRVSYRHADIRNQLIFSEESLLLNGGKMRNLYEPSKILLLFSGFAGILIAARHIRKP